MGVLELDDSDKKKQAFFRDITPDRVLSMVEKTGVKATGRVLQLNSMENRVFEVEIDAEEVKSKYDRYRVVKFLRPDRWSVRAVEEEHKFLLALKENEVPVAAPLHFLSGKTIQADDETGILTIVYPRIGGRSPDELTDEQYRTLGRLIARMHIVGKSQIVSHRPSLTPFTYGTENIEWLYQNRAISMQHEAEYIAVAEEIITYATKLYRGIHLQVLHGDCHLGNILNGSDGLFFVDFDDMLIGPAIQDLWLLVSGTDDWGKEQFKRILEGYTDLSHFNFDEFRLIEVLRALRYICFSTWIAKRWQDPAFPKAFPQFGTDDYWQGQIQDLQNQLTSIRKFL
jgi:Ser/Thr protein kinase RdoA (MazF antagonist)